MRVGDGVYECILINTTKPALDVMSVTSCHQHATNRIAVTNIKIIAGIGLVGLKQYIKAQKTAFSTPRMAPYDIQSAHAVIKASISTLSGSYMCSVL